MPPKPPLTHFLCLPLINASSRAPVHSSLRNFASYVASTEDLQTSIPSSAIRPLGTIHLTLGVMSLRTQERIDAATAFLRSLDLYDMLLTMSSPVEKPQTSVPQPVAVSPPRSVPIRLSEVSPLKVTLEGLHPMQSSEKTSILYASPNDSTSRLHPFCLALRQAFTAAGFLLDETRPLLLHATIVNTIYAKDRQLRDKGGGNGKNRKGAHAFDAREIIERHEGFKWAEDIKIEKVSICETGAKKVYENEQLVDEQYTEIASLPLVDEDDSLPVSSPGIMETPTEIIGHTAGPD